MKIIDNTSLLLGDDLKATLGRGARLKIAASCFSIYAFEALKAELSKLESLQFIFTAPTFVPMEVTDRLRKERREFFIPAMKRERGLYGTEFEIQLRNKLTQRAVARECADWIRKKARFRSNTTKAPMQQFIHLGSEAGDAAYMPISGFTAVDLGYQKGDAVSNLVTRIEDAAHTGLSPAFQPDMERRGEGQRRNGGDLQPYRVRLPGKLPGADLLPGSVAICGMGWKV